MKDSGMRQILVDGETGVNYLVWKSGYAGGITPLEHELGLSSLLDNDERYQLCAQPRVCSLTGGNPVYPRPNQPDISESWDGISNGA